MVHNKTTSDRMESEAHHKHEIQTFLRKQAMQLSIVFEANHSACAREKGSIFQMVPKAGGG